MRVMIVDDEKPTLDLMIRSLSAFDDMEIVGAFELPSVALRAAEQLTAAKLDAAFLDISLPGINGIELALRLLEILPDLQVVFVTAFDQYALQAFDANALDYVLKPVTTERLERAVERLRRAIPAVDTGRPASSALLDTQKPQVQITIHSQSGLSIINLNSQKVRFSTVKQEELLRDLILTKIELNKWELIAKFWPELEVKRAEQNLYMTIYRLKQAIREYGLPFKLSADKGRYRLEMTDSVAITQ